MTIKNIKKIILGTGSYQNVKIGNTVSISGDKGFSCGYSGQAFMKLAPYRDATYRPYHEKLLELQEMKKDLTRVNEYLKDKKQIEDEYIKSYYETKLRCKNADALLEELYEKFGNDIVLLCYEEPGEFCHRRLVADYLEIMTGIYIPEISVDDSGNITRINPIRYKNRLKKIILKNRDK